LTEAARRTLINGKQNFPGIEGRETWGNYTVDILASQEHKGTETTFSAKPYRAYPCC